MELKNNLSNFHSNTIYDLCAFITILGNNAGSTTFAPHGNLCCKNKHNCFKTNLFL